MTGRFAFSRRTAIKGGVLAGAALSAPLLPGLSKAYAYDVATETVPLRGPSRRHGRVPGATHHHHELGSDGLGSDGFTAASTADDTYLSFAPVDTEPFYMVALSWLGAPGTASVRAADSVGVWSDWYELTGSGDESPDDGGTAPERCWTQPAWVGDDHTRVEVAVPDGADDVLVHLITKTGQRVTNLRASAAGAAPLIIPRSSWTSAGPAYEPYSVASQLQLAVVHHSVGSNGYSPEQVPGILEGIRQYHVGPGRGYNDIAYNFAIDRFGRIWEARGGGIENAVVGGHALGWNSRTMGVVFLGDYTQTGTQAAGIAALTALLKWKFNRVHNVDPSGSTVYVVGASGAGSRFAAGQAVGCRTVVAHRDVSQTACPGSIHGAIEGVWNELVRLDDVRGISASPRGGYYLVTGYGAVHTRRGSPFFGSMNGEALNAPALTLAPTPSGNGYWMLAADGGIFSFGDARFHGSTGGMRLNQPVVGMAATRTGNGYWLVASDGGIFAFGDAHFFGSMGGTRLNQPMVGMAPTRSGNGYWLVAADAGVFAFGDAPFVGSGGGTQLSAPAVAVGPHPGGHGYWVALADGRVLPFNVPDFGSAPANRADPVVGISVTPSGNGYLLVRRSGVVHGAGDAAA